MKNGILEDVISNWLEKLQACNSSKSNFEELCREIIDNAFYDLDKSGMVRTCLSQKTDWNPPLFSREKYTIIPKPITIETVLDLSSEVKDNDSLKSIYLKFCSFIRRTEDFDMLSTMLSFNKPLKPKKLKPEVLMNMRKEITKYNLVPDVLYVSGFGWQKMVCEKTLQELLDPVSKFELLKTGTLAKLLGLALKSDCFFHPESQFLNSKQLIMLAHKTDLGWYDITDFNIRYDFESKKATVKHTLSYAILKEGFVLADIS